MGGLTMDVHPGIVFRDGPAGRRPAVIGGPDVWEIIQVFLDLDRDPRRTAEYLKLRPGLMDVAISYYADNQTDIDDWIGTNRRMLQDAAAAFERRQGIADV
jgi:hypothetical protein